MPIKNLNKISLKTTRKQHFKFIYESRPGKSFIDNNNNNNERTRDRFSDKSKFVCLTHTGWRVLERYLGDAMRMSDVDAIHGEWMHHKNSS